MYSAEQYRLFTDFVEAEALYSQKLLAALQQENELLRGRDADQLGAVTRSKQILMQEFETQLAAHDRFLQSLRLPTGKAGRIKFLQTLPSEDTALQHWLDLQRLAKQCRAQNDINGSIINLCRHHVQQALDILRGTEQHFTYGPAGKARQDHHSHPLAKA